MKAAAYLLFTLTLIAGISSCQKGSVIEYDFTQITFTDSSGTVVEADTTDWGYDNSWTGGEYKLVSFEDSLKSTDSMPGYVQLSPPFPNPGNGFLLMGVDVERACKMKMVVVDKNFQILYYKSRLFTGGAILTVHDLSNLTALDKGNYYRMYYGFFNSKDSLYYKGHGDLLIQ